MFKLFPLKNGLENVQGFFFGAANVGMRTKKVSKDASLAGRFKTL